MHFDSMLADDTDSNRCVPVLTVAAAGVFHAVAVVAASAVIDGLAAVYPKLDCSARYC
jgi:hypothetical protein